jgi:type II secretory pathway pseudopilin PulG
MKSGFTLIETLVIAAVIAVLTTAVISSLQPLEQIRKGWDRTLLSLASQFHNAVLRTQASQNFLPWTEDISQVPLDSSPAQSYIDRFISTRELKQSFANQHRWLAQLFLTASPTGDPLIICFQPHSAAFRHHQDTSYDAVGNLINCTGTNTCFHCLYTASTPAGDQNNDFAAAIPPSSSPSPTPEPSADLCSDFNPEYPSYPWTCNYSSTWSQYGCTNFCVADLGCDGYCGPAGRHLRKNYYGTGLNFIPCLMSPVQTSQDYCTYGAQANCSYKSYSSNSSDFEYGCTNPIRPIRWIQ